MYKNFKIIIRSYIYSVYVKYILTLKFRIFDYIKRTIQANNQVLKYSKLK